MNSSHSLSKDSIRKIIIAAGKSTRFSKAGRKQLALADGFSTLLLHARQATGIHCCADVVVMDAVTAHQALGETGLVTEDVPASRVRRKLERSGLPRDVVGLIGGGRLNADDFPGLYAEAARRLGKRKNRARAEALLDEFADTVYRPFVESIKEPIDGVPLLGKDIIPALAKPWGPGEAFFEGLRRLKQLGLSAETRYVMPVYSDYAPALLPRYPRIYMQTIEGMGGKDKGSGTRNSDSIKNLFILIGAKSPLDKVKDRGNVVFSEGSVPEAIREWRDMTKEERREAQRRLEQSRETGEPHHGLNAGVFIIDRAWAERQDARIHREFNHPDQDKSKRHEYWYTDLVELAARQKKPRQVVFLGEDAPSGCKDQKRMQRYADDLAESIRQILSDLGVRLDKTARVRIRSLEPLLDLKGAIKRIFSDRPDSVRLRGDIFIEDTARVAAGAYLDGRKEPVKLLGHTFTQKKVTGGTFVDEVVPPDVSVRSNPAFPKGLCEQRVGSSKAPAKAGHYKPKLGAFLIGELRPKDRKGVLRFIRREMEQAFDTKIADRTLRKQAKEATNNLWHKNAILDAQTAESLYRHLFGWVRIAAGGRDPYEEEKRKELEALRPMVDERRQDESGHRGDKSTGSLRDCPACQPSQETHQLFRQLTLLATQANLYDWQSPTVRELLKNGSSQSSVTSDQYRLLSIQHPASSIRSRFTFHELYDSMIFDSPATFLYLTDNTGEALFDTLVWAVLCRLGHEVVVAAKEKPAGGDATVRDVKAIARSFPELRPFLRRGKLRIISNGNDTYGTFLDRLPQEFLNVYCSPKLRAIIGKGQANLYTTVARNTLNVPYVAQYLVKGITAERLTGIRTLRRGDKKFPRPVVAVIPAGERITECAPGTKGARTLKEVISDHLIAGH